MSSPLSSAETAQMPGFEIPGTTPNIVNVRVIDTTARIHMPVGTMFDPIIRGHTQLSSPSYSFLIENEALGRKVLFDLGVQKSWREQAPSTVEMIEEFGWVVHVEKDVAEILRDHAISLDSIDAIIWSHGHWDHLGDPSTFPESTEIIVGPGFLEDFFPEGQPTPDSPIREEYYKNRNLREISTAEFSLDIDGFPAFDYFQDGSFYLIDSPGHATGHICALARTTSDPDTFIFMGGDIASHAGEFRPSKHVPIPSLISPNPLNPSSPSPCPGHIFTEIHPQERRDTPFYHIGTWPDGDSVAEDLPAAIESHQKLQLIDANPTRVFVILAHDENIIDVIDFFPRPANQWKQLGWAEKARWMFLGDFQKKIKKNKKK